MSNVVFYTTYKLKEGVSVEDFLIAKSNLSEQQVSKKKGWVSSTYLRDGDVWADYGVWETMDDYKAFILSSRKPTELAKTMYGFIDFNTLTSRVYTVERHITPETIK
ncbi:MAG: hypothetical protein FWC95_05370 [Defluviitaleaceae bacterium]|nr:hypothetical protein [Defluviitaleaceae bacterium]